MIRSGFESDVTQIVTMAEEFWSHAGYDEEYCPDTTKDFLEVSLSQGLLSVLEIDGKLQGFACGIKSGLLGNINVCSGTELAWWVNPSHRSGRNGIGLLKHLEELAKMAGVKYWNMAFMESSMPKEVESIYKKLGYTKKETIYQKVI